jgi:hypothetical protein
MRISLTEQQAMSKWCPFARGYETYGDRPVSQNRDSNGQPDRTCMCLARACMAWRWTDPNPIMKTVVATEPSEIEPARPAHVPLNWEWEPASWGDDGNARWVEPEEEWMSRRRGMCGAFAGPVGRGA